MDFACLVNPAFSVGAPPGLRSNLGKGAWFEPAGPDSVLDRLNERGRVRSEQLILVRQPLHFDFGDLVVAVDVLDVVVLFELFEQLHELLGVVAFQRNG